MRPYKILTLALSLTVLALPSAHAQEQPNILTLPEGQALMHISATERMEIKQDLLVATMRIEIENRDAGYVQNEINKAMQQAAEIIKNTQSGKTGDDELKFKTLQYSVYETTLPRTKEKVWRGSQGLELKSLKSEDVIALVTKLQELGFVSSNLSYTLSPAKAVELQDGMMESALAQLQTRAQRAAKALGKSEASLIEINVQGNDISMPVNYGAMHRNMAVMELAAAPMAAPVASEGEATLTLTVSAKALLKP